MSNAKLIYDFPERNADLFYATHFRAPDPIFFLEINGKKHLFLSDLEINRGLKKAHVDKVHSLSQFQKKAKMSGEKGLAGVVHTVLKEFKIKTLTVPHRTPFTLADGLRKKGYKILPGENPFYPRRAVKMPKEKKSMRDSQRVTFQAIALAEKILRESVIKGEKLYWKKESLTSERLRQEVEIFLLKQCYHNTDLPIISCGIQSTDCHEIGNGVLKPHTSIIVDIFPRSDKTHFYGDATRTFCKGKASPKLKKMYQTVKMAQAMAISKIRAGVNGKTIYESVVKYFDQQGYPTKEINGFKQGFIHGVGHGIGLEIHEEPVRISAADFILKPGHVVTVEPGLYYRNIGGVRLEDIVSVTKKGCELFPSYPRHLEIP